MTDGERHYWSVHIFNVGDNNITVKKKGCWLSSKTPKHEREQDKKETIEHRKESRLTSPSAGRRFVESKKGESFFGRIGSRSP
jgi:hypothetical protein